MKPFPWRLALLLKLLVAEMVKKFPAFYGIRGIIIIIKRARHWALSWVRWIHVTSSYLSFRRSSSYTPRSAKWFHPPRLLDTFLRISHLYHIACMLRFTAVSSPSNNIWRWLQVMNFVIRLCSSVRTFSSCVLRPNILDGIFSNILNSRFSLTL
jgi:hypothetical protein